MVGFQILAVDLCCGVLQRMASDNGAISSTVQQGSDAAIVEQRQQEVFQENLSVIWLCCLWKVVWPIRVALFVGLLAILIIDIPGSCDDHLILQIWCYVLFGLMVVVNYRRLMNILQIPQRPEMPNSRFFKMMHWSFCILQLGWYIVGIYSASVALSSQAEADDADCNSGLQEIMLGLSSFMLVFNLMYYLHFFGFHFIVRRLIVAGWLTTRKAAPAGSLEKSTDAATLNDVVAKAPCCSICLETFEKERELVKTTVCGPHVYHKKCLEGWLKVSSDCPLCRTQLSS